MQGLLSQRKGSVMKSTGRDVGASVDVPPRYLPGKSAAGSFRNRTQAFVLEAGGGTTERNPWLLEYIFKKYALGSGLGFRELFHPHQPTASVPSQLLEDGRRPLRIPRGLQVWALGLSTPDKFWQSRAGKLVSSYGRLLQERHKELMGSPGSRRA